MPPAGANILRIEHAGPDQSAFDAALAETDAAASSTPRYQDVCKAMNTNLPWATHVGRQPLWRRLDQAQGLRLDACSGRRTLRRPSREMVDREVGATAGASRKAARSRSGRLPRSTRAYSCCHIILRRLATGSADAGRLERADLRPAAPGAWRSDRRLYQSVTSPMSQAEMAGAARAPRTRPASARAISGLAAGCRHRRPRLLDPAQRRERFCPLCSSASARPSC